LNIYDTKVVVCINCEKAIGEIEFDAMIIHSLCGPCKLLLAKDSKTLYIENYFLNTSRIKISQVV